MYNAKFDDKAEEYFKIRDTALIRMRGEMILSAINKVEGDLKMCEIGGGTGNMVIFLASQLKDKAIQINVFEPLKNYVKFASRKLKNYKNILLINDKIEALEQYKKLNSGVNFFYTVDTLHHIKNPSNILDLLKRDSNIEKYFAIIEPNNYNPYTYLYHKLKKGEEVFNHKEFIAHAKVNGWKVVERNYFYAIPFLFYRFKIFKIMNQYFSKSKFFCGSVFILLYCERNI